MQDDPLCNCPQKAAAASWLMEEFLCNQPEVEGSQASQGRASPAEWACTQQELHLCVYSQENLRPKSPSFVPDVRAVFGGKGGRTQASGAGHFIVEASVPDTTSSARPGIG